MPRGEEIKKSGILLRKTEVKDADSMVLCLGEEGLFHFYAKGVRKITSKNAPSLSELTLGEYTLFPSSSVSYLLKEGYAKDNFMKEGDFEAVAVENFLCELSSRIFNEEEGEGKEFYPYLYKGLSLIKDGFDPLTIAYLCFATALKQVGFGVNVDSCVKCGEKKGIVSFSFADGGYICKNCYEGEYDGKRSEYGLKLLRYGFRYNLASMGSFSLEKRETIALIREMELYFHDAFGYHLKTLQFLLKFY